MRTHLHTNRHTHTHTQKHTLAHINTHTNTHTHTHTHMHTNTHSKTHTHAHTVIGSTLRTYGMRQIVRIPLFFNFFQLFSFYYAISQTMNIMCVLIFPPLNYSRFFKITPTFLHLCIFEHSDEGDAANFKCSNFVSLSTLFYIDIFESLYTRTQSRALTHRCIHDMYTLKNENIMHVPIFIYFCPLCI